MRILLSPQFRDDAISLARSGEVLIVNGARFDLSPLPEGYTLPAVAISSAWFAGDVVRRGGVLQVTILFPHALDADEAARFPAPIIDPPDGPIGLPDAGTAAPMALVDEEGVIDWTQVISSAANQTVAVDAERDRRMLLPFAFQSVLYDADAVSQSRIEKARLSALAAVAAGAQAGDFEWPGAGMPFAWIAADNSQHPMDAQTTVAFGSVPVAREGLLIMAARAIKDRILAGETIENVTEDALWQIQT